MSTEQAAHATHVLAALDGRIEVVLGRVRESALWRALTASDGDRKPLTHLMRELYREAFSYHRPVFEAASTMIGRFPTSEARVIGRLFDHLADEATHGEMALDGHVKLGGDRDAARNGGMSPAAFSVASVWCGLCRFAHPFAYLGAMYFFEASTPLMCQSLLEALRKQGFPEPALQYVALHAAVDVKHSDLFRDVITTITRKYPDAEQAILYGADVFAAVYPLPIFEMAYARA